MVFCAASAVFRPHHTQHLQMYVNYLNINLYDFVLKAIGLGFFFNLIKIRYLIRSRTRCTDTSNFN